MAWPKPKLRNKSSGSLMTSKRSGAAHDGAQTQGVAAESASKDPARELAASTPAASAPDAPVQDLPAADAPAAWPGTAGRAGDEVAEAEAGAESADLPLWDWSPPGGESAQTDDPPDQAAAGRADPPRPEWKPVVTPVEEAGGTSRTPGIGQRRGNLAHLSANPRMRVWRLRLIVAAIVMVGFSLWVSWELGLTLAVIVVIADTIYRSRKGYGGQGRLTGAQRRTSRQLAKLRRAGYRAMHGSIIPESEDQIDHLVIGPAGVFAIDSEDWDKRLAVRTRKGKELWHGPYSKKDRLEHAQWEAQQAGDLLSGVAGKPVTVRPAMAVYGPKIPWDVATIREVDVFSGPRLRKYLRRRARQNGVRPLSDDEVERIYQAANQAFPHLSSGSQAS
jgi:hypothetical protein